MTASLLRADGVTKEEIVKKIYVIAPLDLNTEENMVKTNNKTDSLFPI